MIDRYIGDIYIIDGISSWKLTIMGLGTSRDWGVRR